MGSPIRFVTDLDSQTRCLGVLRMVWKPGIVGFPTKETAIESHVRPLRLMRGYQRTIRIVFNYCPAQITFYQVTT